MPVVPCPASRILYRSRCQGFMLLALLIVLMLGSISLMGAVDVWTVQAQREREKQLLFVGNQYRLAIQSYYYAAPNGSPKVLPPTLAVLLEDDRYPVPVRHLRRLYPDPITGSEEWGLIRVGERIAGVFSRSEAAPIKQAGFPDIYKVFADQKRYQDWVFAFTAAPGTRAIQNSSSEDAEGRDVPAYTPRPGSGGKK